MGAFKEFYLNEMKREKYEIKVDGKLVDTRSAWNACNRSVENMIREIARKENTYYELVDKESTKHEGDFVKGFRTWKGKNGKVVKFEIEKIFNKEDVNEASSYQVSLAKAHGLKHVGNGIYSKDGINYKFDVNRFIKTSESKPEKDSMRFSSYAERDKKLKDLGAFSFTYGNIYKTKSGELYRLGDDSHSIEKIPGFTYHGIETEYDADRISGQDIKEHIFKNSKGDWYVWDSDHDEFKRTNPKHYDKANRMFPESKDVNEAKTGKQVYTSSHGNKKVEVTNGIVTYSDTEYCKVGEKPNLDFLRKCGWRLPKKIKNYDVWGRLIEDENLNEAKQKYSKEDFEKYGLKGINYNSEENQKKIQFMLDKAESMGLEHFLNKTFVTKGSKFGDRHAETYQYSWSRSAFG